MLWLVPTLVSGRVATQFRMPKIRHSRPLRLHFRRKAKGASPGEEGHLEEGHLEEGHLEEASAVGEAGADGGRWGDERG